MADQVLQDIKDRLNVADVIAGYIPVKKSGTNFKAVCPFHHEKSASLMISPAKQIWHCFGCGEGGDVFGFVMRYENLDFKDTLKILADKAGIKLPSFRPENKVVEDEKDLLLRINDFAARYYHQVLMSKIGASALEYLKQRGLSEATIKQWQIGFAPDDFHALEQALAKKNIASALLVKAGVSAQNERGQMYDRFRGRITFPIYNYFGEVVGFSARILNDDAKAAKYVNSPETAIYNKSKTLFGLNFAKEGIRKSDEAVIVEGQMDCIQAHQAGFNNVVASSGTALNEASLTQLGRLTKNLKFCFDADSAGQAAAKRAGEIALRQGFKVKLIVLKAVSTFAKATADSPLLEENKKWAKDPDELIKKSPGLWEKAVKEAVWFLDYHISLAETLAPDDRVEQIHYLTSQVVPLLSSIQDLLEQDHYVRQLTERFGITERVVREQIKPQKTAAPQAAEAKIKAPTYGLEKEILGGMLMYKDYLEEIRPQLGLTDFESPEIRKLLEPMVDGTGQIDQAGPVAKEALFMVESQLDELEGNAPAQRRQLLRSFYQLRLNSIKRQQQEFNFKIQKAETVNDQQELYKLRNQAAEMAALRMRFESMINA